MKRTLNFIMDICEQMLTAGAEVSRVEDCVRFLGSALGATRCDAFIITSSIEITLKDSDDNTYTQTRRVSSISTDIEKLHFLNSLARNVTAGKINIEEAQKELNSISKSKTYSAWIFAVSYAVISGAFTVFFGGGAVECLCSSVIGIVLALIVKITELGSLNKIFAKFFCSFIGALLALASFKLGLVENVDAIIIGFIMTLIPGVGLTTALRDLFVGDSISGVLRTIEAILFAFAIAGGYFLAAFIIGGGSI